MSKMRLKKGDLVHVVSGKDRGKEGKILQRDVARDMVIVENINVATKGVKPTHSLEELIYLRKNIGNDIVFFSATIESKVVAICILFSINKEILMLI